MPSYVPFVRLWFCSWDAVDSSLPQHRHRLFAALQVDGLKQKEKVQL